MSTRRLRPSFVVGEDRSYPKSLFQTGPKMIEQPFPSAFELDVLSELPSENTKRVFYPGGLESGGHDGLNIRVVPYEGEEWIGTFASGRFGPKTVTGVFTTPNPNKFCAISEGQAYIVDVTGPKVCESLTIVPIIAVRSSMKHRLLIFANNTEILAIGVNGAAWRTERLSWDSLKLITTTDDTLCGEFWDVQTESEQGFTVDLANGTHCEGATMPV
jgi:hypothetical protein